MVQSYKQVVANCTFVKTVLMVLVIVCHCASFWTGNWFTSQTVVYNSKELSLIAQWLNSFHIYGFTLVSGYLFFYLKYENYKYIQFKPFLIAKVKRLIVPYLFASTFWVVPITIYFCKFSVNDIIKKYVIACSPSQLWFLWMLFWVFIIFWLLSNVLRTNIIGFVLAMCLYSIGVLGIKYLPNMFCIWSGCQYIIYFWVGFKLREYDEKIIRNVPLIAWLALDIILFLAERMIDPSGIIFIMFELVLHTIGAISAFEILQYFARKIRWRESKTFQLLAKNSMPMYLVHQQVIYFTIMWFNGRVNPYVNAIINFVFAMMISLGLSIILMKHNWTRFLIGEKR